MKTLVTGAGGFVGSGLLRRLVATRAAGDEIVATDLEFPHALPDVDYVAGGIDDPRLVTELVGRKPQRIFHLATVAGVQSATDFALGKRINLDATLALLDVVRASGHRPRFVYSSSVGVFGPPLPDVVDDDTLPVPTNSYGAYKLACELLIADYSRAGFVEGLSLRFPGILARPEGSKTMLSAFMSDVFYAARRGEPFTLPLAPDDGCWLMSLQCCVDNVLHAAQLPAERLPQRRYWNLPALLVTMGDLVAALAEVYGRRVLDLVDYQPVEKTRKMFRQVPLHTPGANQLGLSGDRSAMELVRNSIAGNPALELRP